MKKLIIVPALFITGTFGVGYAVGQIGGATGSLAASAVSTPTATQQAPDAGNPGGPDGGSRGAPHADGTVTRINGNTLTISAGTDPSGTTEYTGVATVTITGSTQYDAGHDSTTAATRSSIKVGSYIIVDGTLSSDGKTITASTLRVNEGGAVPGR